MKWNTKLAASVILAASLFFPLLDKNAYHIDVASTAGIFIILAIGLNVVVGFAGLLNLGYAAFYAIGAYTYALLNIHAGINFWFALPLCAVITAFFGFIISIPAIRLRGDYLAIVTLGFGEITRIALNNLDPITGGPNGLMGIAHPLVAGYNFGVKSWPYYYLILGAIVICAFFVSRLEYSRLGRAWVAIREDEVAASCMGVDVVKLKLYAFSLGAGIAGVAGCIFASKQGTVSPDSFDFILSVMVLAMVVLGGLGSIRGAILGAIILTILPELLRGFVVYRMLIFGAAMILIMLFRPQGLIGTKRTRGELRPVAEKKE